MPDTPRSRFWAAALAAAALFFVGILGLLWLLGDMTTGLATTTQPERPRPTAKQVVDIQPTAVLVSTVVVNGVTLSQRTLRTLATNYGLQLPAGYYWYDPLSGFWGYEGEAVTGITFPGINLGAGLRRDASAGNSGVLINGRELPRAELNGLENILGGSLPPGRYYLDGAGNLADEFGNWTNLVTLVRPQSPGGSEQPGAGNTGGSDPVLMSTDGCTVIGADVSCSSMP